MQKTNLIKTFISSYVESVLFIFVGVLTILKPFQSVSVEYQMICCALFSVLSVIGYYGAICKLKNLKEILQSTAIYLLVFIIFVVLNFAVYYRIIDLLPLTDTNAANGLVILICCIIFVFVSLILKVVAAALTIKKNRAVYS